jgi:chromosome partitioning protein
MHVLVLAAQKGGVGKSTILLNLAVEAVNRGDGPVTVVDVDPQASLSRWWNRRGADTPALAEIDLDALDAQLECLRAAGTRLVMIDTPGVISSHVRSVIAAADLVLIPSRASIFDIETLYAFCDLVEAAGRPMTFVPNAIKPRTRISSDAIRNLSAFGTVSPVSLFDRVDYSQSLNDGRAVAELRPDGDGAKEIAELWQYVKTRLRKATNAPAHEDAQ